MAALVAELFSFGEATILEAKNPKGFVPVGAILAAVRPHWLEPEAYWFPWTTRVNKVEGLVRYFVNLRDRGVESMFFSEPEHTPFWNGMAMYGVCRRVGTMFLNSQPVAVWQGK